MAVKMELNIFVVGTSLVGKTSLVSVFVLDTFFSEREYVPTLIDFYRKQLTVEKEDYVINIADTSGSQNDFVWVENELRKGDAFVVVFSVDDLDSFQQTSFFIDISSLLTLQYCLLETNATVQAKTGK